MEKDDYLPTEPLAALVYIFMLVPGIVFVHKSEMHRPTIRRSIFRETSAVVVVSAVCLLCVVLLAFILSFFNGEVFNWFQHFVIDPGVLLRTDSQLFVAVVLSSLLVATALGFLFGTRRFQSWLDEVLGGTGAINRTHSGWGEAFDLFPDAAVVVGVQLKSGTWVQGQLYTYNPLPHDDPDRSLTLTGDIKYRTKEMDEVAAFDGLTMLVIQACEIDFLAVGHNKPVPETNDDPEVAAGVRDVGSRVLRPAECRATICSVNGDDRQPEDQRKHLDFIQATVTRMATASSAAKAWLLPVATAAYGYALTQHSKSVALLGLGGVVLFALLDAQYLRQERAFRALFRAAASGRVAAYEMSNARFYNKPNDDAEDEREENCKWSKVIWSWSLAGFYLPIAVAGFAVFVVA